MLGLRALLLAACIGLLPVTALAVELDVETLQQMVAADPKDDRARLLLTRYLLRTGDLIAAEPQLEVLLDLQPENEVALKYKSQLAAMTQQQALLAEGGLNNPFNPDDIDQALARAEGNPDYPRRLLGWLHQQGFKLSPEARYYLVDDLLKQGRAEDARTLLNTAHHEENNVDSLRLQADACLQLEQWACASKWLNALWQQSPSADTGVKLVKALRHQQRSDDAKVVLDTLKQRWPKDPDVKALLKKRQQSEQANLALLEKQYKQQPDNTLLRSLVWSYYDRGNTTAALTLLDNHLSVYPVDNDTRYMAAEMYAWEGRFQDAHRLLAEVQPATPKVMLLDARIYAWDGKLDNARALLTRMLRDKPSEAIRLQVLMMLGFCAQWERDYPTALKYLEPLLKLDHPVLDHNAMQEAVWLARGDYPQLIAHLEQQLAAQPDKPGLLLHLAEVNQEAGLDAARDWYERYLELVPDNANVRRRLAELYIQIPDYRRGFLHLERYAYQTFSADAFFMLAQNYYWAERYEDAQRVLGQMELQFNGDPRIAELSKQVATSTPVKAQAPQATVSQKPVSPTVSDELKKINQLYFAGDYKGAVEGYSRYLKTHPKEMEVHLRYATALAMTGQHTAASSEFYIVSRSKLNSDDVQFNYGYNLARSGNYHAARQVFKRLLHSWDQETVATPLPDGLSNFVERWRESWQARGLDAYAAHYAADIRENRRWRAHKSRLFRQNKSIQVTLTELAQLSHAEGAKGDLYQVAFRQVYKADTKEDEGYKQLQIRCDRDHNCVIEKEQWFPLYGQKGPGKLLRRGALRKSVEQELAKLEVAVLEKGPGDTLVKGIFLGEGIDKRLEGLASVLTPEYVQAVALEPNGSFGILQDDLNTYDGDLDEFLRNKLTFNLRSFEDSDRTRFTMPTVALKSRWEGYQLNLNLSRYEFRAPPRPAPGFGPGPPPPPGAPFPPPPGALPPPGAPLPAGGVLCHPGEGEQVDLSLARRGLTFGGKLNRLRDRYRLLPYVRYNVGTDGVYNSWSLGYSALFFDKLTCPSLDRRLTRLRGEFSQYRVFNDTQALWYSTSLGRISDDNLELIAQLDYVFDKGQYQKLNYTAAFNGWYIWHRFRSREYYSPVFYDSSRVRLETQIPVSEQVPGAQLETRTSLGYTFEESKPLYDYGVWINYPLQEEGLQAKVGCRKSNSGRSGQSRAVYRSTDCGMTVEYEW